MATKKKRKAKKLEGKVVNREVWVPLTEAEFAEKAKSAAAASLLAARHESDFEEVKSVWKAKIQAAEAERDTILETIRKGKERREVPCIEVKIHNEKRVEYWLDGEMVDVRDMLDSDRQEDLPLKGGKATTPASEDKACVATPGKPVNSDVGAVIRAETGRKTKTSSVDGARA